jgi:hypothetical protein
MAIEVGCFFGDEEPSFSGDFPAGSRAGISSFAGVLERNRLWVLKNSISLKTTKIWGIETVSENRESRL